MSNINKTRIIFLDIDGVLNVISKEHDKHGAIFHQHFTDNLKDIIDETGAKIVLSSSWRKNGLVAIKEMWADRKLPGEVIDVTPSLYLQKNGSIQFWNDKLERHPTEKIRGYSIPRGCEIEYWLNNESVKYIVENYVILDDDTDFLFKQRNNFVQCSGNTTHDDCIDIGYGLTNICTGQAIKILGSKPIFDENDFSVDWWTGMDSEMQLDLCVKHCNTIEYYNISYSQILEIWKKEANNL